MLTPELEEQQARMAVGVSLTDFENMPGTPDWCDEQSPVSKSDVIAIYRTQRLIEAIQTDIATKKGQRR